ncbi:Na+/H+ antiporter subunit E [bacterium LRH843]|nr:Na+/H+ antiporter subunit E [bacterium LRH843]
MAFQLLINLFVALLWMFLQDEWSFLTLFTGYLIGLAVIFGLRRFFPTAFYLRTVYAAFKLVLIFHREAVVSGVLVAKQGLYPKLKITPGIFELETTLKKEWEVVVLALLLTLTPGSTVIEISPKRDKLYLHGMDIPDSQDAVIKSTVVYEKAIREVSR